MVEGDPSTFNQFYSKEYSSLQACEMAISLEQYKEPWLSLKSEHPDLKIECWPIDE
jgi:hypothetical protein